MVILRALTTIMIRGYLRCDSSNLMGRINSNSKNRITTFECHPLSGLVMIVHTKAMIVFFIDFETNFAELKTVISVDKQYKLS